MNLSYSHNMKKERTSMLNGRKICVVLPAYNATDTLEKTYSEIPHDVVDDVILVDDADDCTRDEASFLWTVFTRFEPAADIHAKHCRLERFHAQLSAPIVIDCRLKPWYPPPVEPLPETVARVDDLWPKLFV